MSANYLVALWEEGGWWSATKWGKGHPILRSSTDGRPTTRATWPSRDAALEEIPRLVGAPVVVVREYRANHGRWCDSTNGGTR